MSPSIFVIRYSTFDIPVGPLSWLMRSFESGAVQMRGLMLVSILVTGCTPTYEPIAPVGMVPTGGGVVAGWVSEFRPSGARRYVIRPWRYRNERGAAAGRAAVVVVPPDSLRLDYQGPFGKAGRAAVVGDSALWVVPEEEFGGLVALAPLFWAAVGVPQPPPENVPVHALARDDLKAWRYILAGDTLSFVVRGNPPRTLQAEVRRGGRTLGVTEVEFDRETGLVAHAKIELPFDVSRFEFTIQHVDTVAAPDPSIWQNR